jgi:hypothetical protein
MSAPQTSAAAAAQSRGKIVRLILYEMCFNLKLSGNKVYYTT